MVSAMVHLPPGIKIWFPKKHGKVVLNDKMIYACLLQQLYSKLVGGTIDGNLVIFCMFIVPPIPSCLHLCNVGSFCVSIRAHFCVCRTAKRS